MSVVTAARGRRDVVVAGDSLWSDPSVGEGYRWPHSKLVLRQDAGIVVGVVGSGRVLQAVRSMELDAPSSTQTGSWVTDVFATELLRTARNGVGELSGAEPGRPLGRRTMLVLAWGSQLWLLSSDLVAREIESFVAIGSGRHWAYGAWSALEGLDLDPLERIHRVLKATSSYCITVDGPFGYVRTSDLSTVRAFRPGPATVRSAWSKHRS